MNPSTVNDILSILSDRFGTTADHLWQVLVGQALLEGQIAGLIAAFCAVMVIISAIAIFLCMLAASQYKYRDIDWPVPVGIISGVLFIGCFAVMCYQVPTAYAYYANPEFYAVDFVLKALRPIVK